MKVIITLDLTSDYAKEKTLYYLGQKIAEEGVKVVQPQFPLINSVKLESVEVQR